MRTLLALGTAFLGIGLANVLQLTNTSPDLVGSDIEYTEFARSVDCQSFSLYIAPSGHVKVSACEDGNTNTNCYKCSVDNSGIGAVAIDAGGQSMPSPRDCGYMFVGKCNASGDDCVDLEPYTYAGIHQNCLDLQLTVGQSM